MGVPTVVQYIICYISMGIYVVKIFSCALRNSEVAYKNTSILDILFQVYEFCAFSLAYEKKTLKNHSHYFQHLTNINKCCCFSHE
jgi:hypothetical protein